MKFWLELLDYLHCCWAQHEIDPRKNDVVKIQTTIINFEHKYGKDWAYVFCFGKKKNKQSFRRSAKKLPQTKATIYRTMASLCIYTWNCCLSLVDYFRRDETVVSNRIS